MLISHLVSIAEYINLHEKGKAIFRVFAKQRAPHFSKYTSCWLTEDCVSFKPSFCTKYFFMLTIFNRPDVRSIEQRNGGSDVSLFVVSLGSSCRSIMSLADSYDTYNEQHESEYICRNWNTERVMLQTFERAFADFFPSSTDFSFFAAGTSTSVSYSGFSLIPRAA